MLWDKETNKASRVGYKTDGTTKTRYFKKSGNAVS
jgi:ribosomal protein L24